MDAPNSYHDLGTDGNLYGSVVYYGCYRGYYFGRQTREENITCLATGEWSGAPRDCICKLALRIIKKLMSTDKTIDGHRQDKYSCIDVYMYFVWCTAIECPALPRWANMLLSTEDTSVGTHVNVTCSDGYVFSDGSSSTHTTVCNSHGEWNPAMVDCQGKTICEFQIAKTSVHVAVTCT